MILNVSTHQIAPSRIELMLNAKQRLPKNLSELFEALFQRNLTVPQACEQLNLTPAELDDAKTSMLRRLKAASA